MPGGVASAHKTAVADLNDHKVTPCVDNKVKPHSMKKYYYLEGG